MTDLYWLGTIMAVIMIITYLVGFTVGRAMCWPDGEEECNRAIRQDVMHGSIIGGTAGLVTAAIIYLVDRMVI
jgi:hypothetical protein